ncbi:MAG: 30S ribosome-binding factor RbfA [Oscillospiraceae bacterium]|nr:30S ribosome-binding factor RbfA [Oscillospiraceae bacterium]
MPSYNIKINRINEEMIREMSQIIRTVKDPRVNSGFITITHCDVSGDLKFAKIYYSVLNGDFAEVKKGLISAKGYIRREIAERLNLRNTPELTFISDDSMEKGAKISKILSEMEFGDEDE